MCSTSYSYFVFLSYSFIIKARFERVEGRLSLYFKEKMNLLMI